MGTQHRQLFYSPLSGTIWVIRYQKKHLPTHSYPDHQSSFISFVHLLQSVEVPPHFLSLQARSHFLPCNIVLCTQLLYSLPLIINHISLLVSSGTNCLNLFRPIQILAFTAASASPSTINMSLK